MPFTGPFNAVLSQDHTWFGPWASRYIVETEHR